MSCFWRRRLAWEAMVQRERGKVAERERGVGVSLIFARWEEREKEIKKADSLVYL